jgi:hypothetical protein
LVPENAFLENRALPKTARRVDIQFIEYIIPMVG